MQQIPHAGSAVSGSTQISCQSDIPSVSTLDDAKEETLAVQARTESTVQAVTELKAASVTELSVASAAGPSAASLIESTEPSAESVAERLVESTRSEQVEEVARTEVAHRGYKNTRVSVTILKRH